MAASLFRAWLTWCLGADEQDRLAGVGGVRDLGRRRDGRRDRHPERALDLVRGEPHLVVSPVEHQVPARLREVEQVQRLHGDLDVLQCRDVERGDQKQVVGLVEGLQHELVERRGGVDDDEVELLLEQVQDPSHEGRRDRVLRVRLHRRDQRRELVVVVGQQWLHDVEVQPALKVYGVRDRARREDLQRDRHVPEGQVEVDHADLLRAALGQRQGEVHRQRGLADTALGGEDGDQPPAVRLRPSCRAAAERLPHLACPAHRRAEAGQVALLHDLPHAAAQRLCQHPGVDTTTDQDDADRRTGDAQSVRERRGRLEVDRRAEHDGVLVGRLRQEVLELLEGADDV